MDTTLRLERIEMKPRFGLVLENAIEQGVAMGIRRAFKHDDNPSHDAIQSAVENDVMLCLHEWFVITRDDDEDKTQ